MTTSDTWRRVAEGDGARIVMVREDDSARVRLSVLTADGAVHVSLTTDDVLWLEYAMRSVIGRL